MAIDLSQHQAKRYFTLAEANSRVPELSMLFGLVMQLRGQLKVLYQQLDEEGHAPSNDHDEEDISKLPPDIARLHRVFVGLADTLREQIEVIMATGCVIKDIETGLVDWLALFQGREIWLCWKYGETEVSHWHELNTGFSGRRPVSELRTDWS